MRRLACLLAVPALLLAAGGGARALSLPVEEADYLPPEATTTYVERSLNHQAPLVIEHPPVERNPRGRRRGDAAAIAGFCRDGGTVMRRDASGRPTYLRQREVCDNVAPRILWPGHVDPRPAWPAERARTRHRVVTKG